MQIAFHLRSTAAAAACARLSRRKASSISAPISPRVSPAVGLIAGAAVFAFAERNDTESALPRACRTLYHALIVGYEYRFGPPARLPRGTEERGQALAATHQRAADRLLHVCMVHGGLYIKLGQYLASLNHVLPPQYPATLAACQDRASAQPFDLVRPVIEEELGCRIEDVFGDFSPAPIAAASLAQVHEATTLDGQRVACKVQYPQLRAQVAADLLTLRLLTWLVGLAFPHHEYGWLVPEFEVTISEELSFRREEANAQRTRRLFAHEPRVYVPRTLPHLSGERLLTMEWIEGVRVDDEPGLAALGIRPSELAPLVSEVFSSMIFGHGFVHCDPHPGNLLARRRPAEDGRIGGGGVVGGGGDSGGDGGGSKSHGAGCAQLVLLDHGMYRQLEPSFREQYSTLWASLLTRDHASGRRAALALGVRDEDYDALSLVLTFRSAGSAGPIGATLTPDERARLRARYGKLGASDVNAFLERLPRDFLFVMRTWALVRSLNRALGGTTRQRLLVIAEHAAAGMRAHPPSTNVTWRQRAIRRVYARWARWKMAILVRCIDYGGLALLKLGHWHAMLRKGLSYAAERRRHSWLAQPATAGDALVDALGADKSPEAQLRQSPAKQLG